MIIASTKIAPSGPTGAKTADILLGGAGSARVPHMLALPEIDDTNASLSYKLKPAGAESRGKSVVDIWGFLKNGNVVC